jgi:NAD+--asparagine ADP-ribosyltransferase
MAERIIEVLDDISKYPSIRPYACLKASMLNEVMEKIKELPYNDFFKVKEYVRSSNLPSDFKEELEVEHAIRSRLKE